MILLAQPSLLTIALKNQLCYRLQSRSPSVQGRRTCTFPSIYKNASSQFGYPSLSTSFRSAPAASAANDGDGGAPPSPSRKGFGVKKKEKGADAKKAGTPPKILEQGGVKPERKGSRQLSKVVDIVDKKSSGRSSIDPAQAKLGKVDFVQVQNWGPEGDNSLKLEDLKVKSFSPAASSVENKTDMPFYEKLVNRLQLLESKGDMAVAQVKPLPSFDRWAFGEDRYVQFLVDQRSVFEALRDGIGAICEKRRQNNIVERQEGVRPLGGAACAIGLFDMDLGLDRCEVLSADISCIIDASKVRGETHLASISGSTQAAGYAKYLKQLGRISLGEDKKAKVACLKFLAHLFAVYVSHLTTGMRIGAKALDNVTSLKYTKALSFYREYGLKGKDPLDIFIATINSAGSCITSEDDQELVLEELAKAFQRTSLLLSVLAVEGQVMVAHE